MRILMILVFLATSISSLVGCSNMRGNVVPQTGPTMAQVYDSMGVAQPKNATSPVTPSPTKMNSSNSSGEDALPDIRSTAKAQTRSAGLKTHLGVSNNTFHKLPNPELKMYVYPHLAGESEIPIPGYTTVFNAYSRDHYQLPQETTRE
ncbi:MAG TPA: TIGR03751 family conjugal transfer lipoprotein [Gammaproteobacteria bacterium]|nr:TIGR03751 family conjugal transfer lipoprotein [Gammaproteobacteria bacterium]HVY53948.1 TIGR03751 family conjugal transfer lipoprotein [Gammaproteobacteria bacterium]